MTINIKQLKKWLNEHNELKQTMESAENYFRQDNEYIMGTKKLVGMIRKNSEGKDTVSKVENPYASNKKLPSGFLKQQIKQKVNYLINDNLTLSDQVEELKELFPNWSQDIKKLATKVSYQIYGAWQFYIDEDSDGKKKVAYKHIEGTQLYPIFLTNKTIPDLVMRNYETLDGTEKTIIYDNLIEIHFIRNKDSKWELEKQEPIVKKITSIAEDTIEEQAVELSQPPFAICFNNDEWQTDLKPIKPFIDIYDEVNSDFANNIIDFQEIYHTLKNYKGQNLEEFNRQLKILKIVPVGEDGDMKTHQVEVPVESKKTFLELTRKNIFEFGMAVDVQNIATGNATVVAIQSMYENLNMKANDFEMELQDFWRQVIKLTNEFNQIINNSLVLDNYLVFDKSMINNINEIYERLSKWIGILPNEILFRLLPDVDESDAMELLEQERGAISIPDNPVSE